MSVQAIMKRIGKVPMPTAENERALIAQMEHDVVNGDQGWRDTINQRWIAFMRDQAKQRDKIAADDSVVMATAASMLQFDMVRQLNAQVRNMRQLAEIDRAVAAKLERGEIRVEDPVRSEMILRLIDRSKKVLG